MCVSSQVISTEGQIAAFMSTDGGRRTLLWRLDFGFILRDVEFGDIYRLVVRMSKEVESKVEQAWQVFTLLDVLDVVILDFEGLPLLVVSLL